MKLIISFCLLFLLNFQAFSQIVDVKKFGARGDGKTDDTRAIQAAINAGNAYSKPIVYFPAGIYLIGSYTVTPVYFTNYCLKIHSGLTFKGEGIKSVIKLGDHLFDKRDTMANAHIFYGEDIKNVQFTRLIIDMNGGKNMVPENIIKNNMALFVENGNNIALTRMTIKNCSGQNMIAIRGTGHGLRIEKCIFYNGGNYVGVPTPNKYQIDFSFIYTTWDSATIIDNHIEQQNVDIALSNYTGGIEMHGSYGYAVRNTIIGCYPAFFISSTWHPMEKTIVTNNKIEKCLKGISFWVCYPLNNITISNNTIGLTHSRLLKPALLIGIEVPNGNIEEYSLKNANNAALSNISIIGNIITASMVDTSKDKTAGLVLHSLKNSRIESNKVIGMNYGGVVLQGSKWGMERVIFHKNQFSNFKANKDEKAVAAYVVITDTYTGTNKNSPGIKKIFFTNNTFTGTKHTSPLVLTKQQHGKFFGAFIAVPARSLNEIHFDKNDFSDKSEKIVSVRID